MSVRKHFLRNNIHQYFYNAAIQNRMNELRAVSGNMPNCWMIHAFRECLTCSFELHRKNSFLDEFLGNLSSLQFDGVMKLISAIRDKIKVSSDPSLKTIEDYIFDYSDMLVFKPTANTGRCSEIEAINKGLATSENYQIIQINEIAALIIDESKKASVLKTTNEKNLIRNIGSWSHNVRKIETEWEKFISTYFAANDYFEKHKRLLQVTDNKFFSGSMALAMYGRVDE